MSAARVRALAAINRVRRGKSPTVSAAAKAERTTVATIRRWLPATLRRDRAGRLRVKTVGGHELLSDPDRLTTLLKGGALDRLRDLYVSPETR